MKHNKEVVEVVISCVEMKTDTHAYMNTHPNPLGVFFTPSLCKIQVSWTGCFVGVTLPSESRDARKNSFPPPSENSRSLYRDNWRREKKYLLFQTSLCPSLTLFLKINTKAFLSAQVKKKEKQ